MWLCSVWCVIVLWVQWCIVVIKKWVKLCAVVIVKWERVMWCCDWEMILVVMWDCVIERFLWWCVVVIVKCVSGSIIVGWRAIILWLCIVLCDCVCKVVCRDILNQSMRESVDTSLVLSQPATVGYRDDEAPVSPAPAPHCRPPSTTAPVGLSRTPAVRTGCLCWEKSLPALSVWLPALDWTAQSREQRKVPHWPASDNLRKGWEFFQGGRKYEQKQDSFRGVKPTKDIRKY